MKNKLPKINSLFLIQYLMGKIYPHKKSGCFVTSDGKKIYYNNDLHTIREAHRLIEDKNTPEIIKKELELFIDLAVFNRQTN